MLLALPVTACLAFDRYAYARWCFERGSFDFPAVRYPTGEEVALDEHFHHIIRETERWRSAAPMHSVSDHCTSLTSLKPTG